MLLLDTNMLSEMMRPEPERKIVDWIVRQPSSGRRRVDLEKAARAMFADDFDGRVVPFDTEAASAYAEIFAAPRNAGRPSGTIDLIVAAIARVRGASVVTRNLVDFDREGVTIVNPWDEYSLFEALAVDACAGILDLSARCKSRKL